jgi:adenylate cyclase
LERRLTAILAADVVGYSKLLGEDETGTLAALEELRGDLFETKVKARGGKIIKRMGDGWIIEYPNVSDAVANAIEIQAGLADHEIIKLRIGVHTGDVTFQENDIYGDGINVAARLEALAAPGQVLISDIVHHSLDGKTNEKFSGGESHKLKNIARSVAVWCWPADAITGAASRKASEDTPLALPEKPSIAVLPFENMSGDPAQEYFSDGIAEDIITALSKLRWLFVIARNSSFHYKGVHSDVRLAAKELGVRYVLEGSVRKAGNRLRVTAQLIEAKTGNHIWAERFDRQLADIFDLQDEITASIASTVDIELEFNERQISRRKPPSKLGAWDFYQRGIWYAYHFTNADIQKSLEMFEKSVALDSNFALGHVGVSLAYFSRAFLSIGTGRDIEQKKALAAARCAVECDDRDALSHWALGRAYLLVGDYEPAIEGFRSALAINPNFAAGHYNLGWALGMFGEFTDAIVELNAAYRLSPRDPFVFSQMGHMGMAYLQLGEIDKAWEWSERGTRQPNSHFLSIACACAIAAYGERLEDSKRLKKELLRLRPDFKVEMFTHSLPYRHIQHEAKILEGFSKAGLL